MIIKICALILVSAIAETIDTKNRSKIAEIIGIEGLKLNIEDVTEMDSSARNIALFKVWIFSSPEVENFFPVRHINLFR